MNSETRMKVKQYTYEKDALVKFLETVSDEISDHVKNAVSYRLGVVNRELKILQK